MALGGVAAIVIMALSQAPSLSFATAEELRPPTAVGQALDASSPESLGAQALALITYPWQDLGYEVAFLPAKEGLRGLTYPYEKRIEIYVRPSDTPETLAHVVAHEVGHVVDVVLNTGTRRVRWLHARGLPADYRWWPASGESDFATGAGDFAECFAVWQVAARSLSEIDSRCADDLALLRELADPSR